MKRFTRSIAVSLLAWTTALATAQGAQEQSNQQRSLPNIREDDAALPAEVKARTSFAQVAKKVAPSVVNVYSTRAVRERGQVPFFNDPLFRRFFGGGDEEGDNPSARPRKQQGLGSGVIVSEDGYIITNNHVVEDASEVRVALVSGEEFPATVVGTDPATDIAIVKVKRTGLPAVTLADSARLEVGDTVLAVGNPFGIGQTVTVGIVSGLGRAGIGIVDYEDFIQTDASINPGNSGGALTDVLGRLVGINTAILSRTGGNQGVGFAVPVNIARNVMEQIIQNGHVTRGYLGILIQPLTPALAKAFNLTDQKGALVAGVSPRSPAAKAGLKEGDVITEFNGKDVVDSKHLRLMVAQTPPDTKAAVRYLREGKPGEVNVAVGELRSEELAQARGGTGGFGHSESRGAFIEGVQVSELDPQTRRQLNLPEDVQGLVITDVESGTTAERAGLQAGDVIEELNRKPVRTLRDATAMLHNEQEGAVLLRVWSDGGSRYVVLETGGEVQPRTRDLPNSNNSRPRSR
jgi:serine protease Do